jgi:hypothetical protein
LGREVAEIQLRLDGLFLLWIRLVGILPLFNRLYDPCRIPLCVLDFLLCLLVDWAPDVRDVEEGRCRVEGCRRLPGVPFR